jgi:hypothetical protein
VKKLAHRADTRGVTPPRAENGDALRSSAAVAAEDALIAADRWALWSTLARGLSHGLANAAQMLALEPLPASARAEVLERLGIAIERLTAAHRPEMGPAIVSDVLADTQSVQRLQSGWPSSELSLDVAPALPALAIASGDLAHVLLALVTDAKQAAGDRRSAITLRAREAAAGVVITREVGSAAAERPSFDRHAGLLHVARLLARRAGGELVWGERANALCLELPEWRRRA